MRRTDGESAGCERILSDGRANGIRQREDLADDFRKTTMQQRADTEEVGDGKEGDQKNEAIHQC